MCDGPSARPGVGGLGIPQASTIRVVVMSKNGLYLVIAILAVIVVGFGIYAYQQQQKPSLEVHVNGNGLSVDGNT